MRTRREGTCPLSRRVINGQMTTNVFHQYRPGKLLKCHNRVLVTCVLGADDGPDVGSAVEEWVGHRVRDRILSCRNLGKFVLSTLLQFAGL